MNLKVFIPYHAYPQLKRLGNFPCSVKLAYTSGGDAVTQMESRGKGWNSVSRSRNRPIPRDEHEQSRHLGCSAHRKRSHCQNIIEPTCLIKLLELSEKLPSERFPLRFAPLPYNQQQDMPGMSLASSHNEFGSLWSVYQNRILYFHKKMSNSHSECGPGCCIK